MALPGGLQIRRPAATRLVLLFVSMVGACEGPVGPPGGTQVRELSITPATVSLIIGEFRKLDALPRNKNGTILPGIAVEWSTSNPEVASVDTTGLVTGLSEGDATITAVVEHRTAEALVGVTEPPVASWREHTCAIGTDGQAYCWGLGINGQLGNGTRESALLPTPVVGGEMWATVTMGAGHSCGADTSGEVRCWGRGVEGQLGNGDFEGSSAPDVIFGGLRYSQILAGERHTCGLDFFGTTRCWGWNFDGQVGNGTRVGQHSPVPIAGGQAFVQITAGGRHTCGLDADGGVWCWGDNTFGQIGDGTFDDRLRPVRAARSLSFRWISAGARHTCGIDALRWRAHCWGDNTSAQFGNGTLASSTSPLPATGAPDFSSVASGAEHTCGVALGGRGYCWGAGGFGQLGSGVDVLVGNPRPLGEERHYLGMSVGAAHTCALAESLQIFCWGLGGFGQLGTGMIGSSLVPVPVVGGVTFSRIGG